MTTWKLSARAFSQFIFGSLQSNPAHKSKVIGSSGGDDIVYRIVENSDRPCGLDK